MLVVEVGKDAGVQVNEPGCEGLLNQQGFEEVLDIALQYDEVLARVLMHPRIKAVTGYSPPN